MWYLENRYTLFPLVVDSNGVRVLVLNSIPADADTLGENALGWCGDAQLERLEKMLMNLPVGTRLVFVLMHHAPFRAPGDRLFGGLRSIRNLVDRTEAFGFLSHKPDEASRITVILSSASERNPGVKYLLLCGHRHRGGLGRIGLTLVLERASLAEERGHPWWLFEQGPGLFASAERTPSLAGESEAGDPYRG